MIQFECLPQSRPTGRRHVRSPGAAVARCISPPWCRRRNACIVGFLYQYYLRKSSGGAGMSTGPMTPVRLGRLAAIACVLAAMALCASTLSAQTGGTLTGTVTDSLGAPIFDAEIELVGLGNRTETDEAGAFRFTGLPAGRVVVSARRLGFAPASVTAGLPTRARATRRSAARPSRNAACLRW